MARFMIIEKDRKDIDSRDLDDFVFYRQKLGCLNGLTFVNYQ